MACSYPDYSITDSGDGFTLLMLRNVRYADRVTIQCEIPSAVILYDPNGGSFVESGSTEPLRMTYGPSVHPRVNTLSGIQPLRREGYVLTGWNTSPDGSGQHIGLGSRITTEKNAAMTLYAEWAAETPAAQLAWRDTEDGVMVTALKGMDADSLVIPSCVEGKPVTAIGAGFAEEIALQCLVIPDTVLRIEDGAFTDCTIEHLYFSDTLRQVSDEAFMGSRPRWWHINAAMQPRYQAISDITSFTDKLDLLMLHQHEKKLLLYGGCSMNYGMDSQQLAGACPDYIVLNMGAVGRTYAAFQFACMLPYIGEGDVFLHAPEQASTYQLMSNISCENRMFIAVEGNFDLLAMVDMTTLGDGAFDCFKTFNDKRALMEPCTYEDQLIPLNSYGDNAEQRAASNTKRFDERYGLLTELLTEEGMDRLADCYDRIRAAGGMVYLSYAPINELCVTDDGQAEAFAARWEQGMQERGYEIVSELNNYIMEPRYFYDTDYHLTTSGAAKRAGQLAQDLLPRLSALAE